jgi:RNA polymerase sigma-70 factor, ECF subfamily
MSCAWVRLPFIITARGYNSATENSALTNNLWMAMNALDEPALLARARALDDDALAQIHDTYYTPLFRYIAYRVSDQQVAEDLTSDVFVRFLSALRDHTAPQNSLRGWLYGVAARVVNDHYRQHYRRPETQLPETLVAGGDDPLDHVATRLSRDELQEAMKGLTPDQQDVIALRFGFEMSIREVAGTLGKNEGAIKQLQARAIAALARALNPAESLPLGENKE